MNLRSLYYKLSPTLRRVARRIFYWPADAIDKVSGRKDPMVPPRGMIYTGSGDYRKEGEKFAAYFREFGGLKPDHRVLDVGCGIGRMAVPLTKYLSEKGSYEGFDIVESGITWCRKNISSRYPNFNFTHVSLQNDLYNLSTKKNAADFKFPYSDNEFDFVFLTSVFTHMIPEDVENYLGEIERVLKEGGICFATFFIIDKEAEKLLQDSPDPFFKFREKGYYLHHKEVKAANVGFEWKNLQDMVKKKNLQIKDFIPGFWSNRKKSAGVDFQDFLILKK